MRYNRSRYAPHPSVVWESTYLVTDNVFPEPNADAAVGLQARWLAAGLVLAALSGLPRPAEAIRWRVRSYSLGRATQTLRSDRDQAARRILTQGLDLRAYDLLGDRTGSLSAAIDARYTTDFALPQSDRNRPLFDDRWNDLALRLAYIDWRPWQGVHLRGGRQWSRSPLGVRDFDGLSLNLRPRLDPVTRGIVDLYAGRDVELWRDAFNTDDFDVQGLPATNDDDVAPRAPFADANPWIAGGSLGLVWGDRGAFEFSYRHRWRTDPDSFDARTGSDRFGIAGSASPHRRLTFSASAAYNTLLEGVDEAGVDLSWNLPTAPSSVVTVGLDHRHPWFDSSSIFNLFGTRPHQGAHLIWERGIAPIRTEVDARGWSRIYRGSEPYGDGLADPANTLRVGGAVAHRTDLRLWNHPLEWSSQISLEGDAAGREGRHLLADTRARTPFVYDDLYLRLRTLLLAVSGATTSGKNGVAGTWIAGVDIPIRQIGTFSLLAEHTSRGLGRATTNLFGTLELEFWP